MSTDSLQLKSHLKIKNWHLAVQPLFRLKIFLGYMDYIFSNHLSCLPNYLSCYTLITCPVLTISSLYCSIYKYEKKFFEKEKH